MLSEKHWDVLDKQECTPLHRQIANTIVNQIVSGRLLPGLYLGTTQELANQFCVNRNTMLKAVEGLVIDGWLRTRKRIGVFIAGKDSYHDFREEEAVIDDDFHSPMLENMYEHHFALTYKKVVDAIKSQNILDHDPRTDFTYTHMRQGITNMLNLDLDLSFQVENVCYVRDHAKCFFVLAQMLKGHSGCFVVENPGNYKMANVFKEAGVELMPVNVGCNGINLNELEAICKKKKVKAVFLNTRCQYPTTVCLPENAGKALVDLSERYGFYIIEADYVHEFWYGSKRYPLLTGRFPDANIIYFAPFSRILDYLEYLGFIAGPKKFMKPFISRWHNLTVHNIRTFEKTIEEMLFNRSFHRLLSRTINIFRKKRDYLGCCLNHYNNGNLSFDIPKAGMAYWLNVAPHIPMDKLTPELRRTGEFIIPSTAFTCDQSLFHGLRVNFTGLERHELERTARAICKAVEGY